MIQFYGYNDARAIAAYNKRNLTKMFLIFALICIAISIVAIAIPLYELLYVWGIFAFLLLIVLFASSFSKYDDKILKEKGIKTKHLFVIEEFTLFKDGKEIKENLLEVIDDFMAEMGRFREDLAKGDRVALNKRLKRATNRRRRLNK